MDEFRADRRRLIGGGVLVAGAGLAALGSSRAQSAEVARWEPTPEALDSWLDRPGARHRLVVDTSTGKDGPEGIGYVMHYIYANFTGYGLKPEQLGIVIVFRHGSTAYGYNNAMWAKYGRKFAKGMKLTGDVARRAETMNPLLFKRPDATAPKGMEWMAEAALTGLAQQGVRFAVCGAATEGISGELAGKGGDAKAIEAELKANLVPGALIVPAGVVAVNRAQEHGYTFGSAD